MIQKKRIGIFIFSQNEKKSFCWVDFHQIIIHHSFCLIIQTLNIYAFILSAPYMVREKNKPEKNFPKKPAEWLLNDENQPFIIHNPSFPFSRLLKHL
jgi:hypothetical protein